MWLSITKYLENKIQGHNFRLTPNPFFNYAMETLFTGMHCIQHTLYFGYNDSIFLLHPVDSCISYLHTTITVG